MATQPWERIVTYWRSCGVSIRRGVSLEKIERFQAKYQVAIPKDLLEYFKTSDGTGDAMEHGLFRFWPLAELMPVDAFLEDKYPDRFAYPQCFVFADHCIQCWLYAVKLTVDPCQLAPVYRVTGSDPPGEMMATSFLEFMTRYAEDPMNNIM